MELGDGGAETSLLLPAVVMSYSLHIISFNIPYPPDYGGVMDVFWMAAIAMLVLVEKIVRGHFVSRTVGAGLIVGGWLLMLPMSSVGHVQTAALTLFHGWTSV